MNLEQRNKIALKVFHIFARVTDKITLCNDMITLGGQDIAFNEILTYYNRLKEVQK
tara:strand:- start:16 stop:183 length:168 start_codon:yes stop_codon:yes gene_type:complete